MSFREKWKVLAPSLLTLGIIAATPQTAAAAVSPNIPWSDVVSYVQDTTNTFDFAAGSSPYFKLVQYPHVANSGTVDMVYNVYNSNNGYATEVYGNHTSSDAYAIWHNVAAGYYELTIYTYAWWSSAPPHTEGLACDGNGYVYY